MTRYDGHNYLIKLTLKKYSKYLYMGLLAVIVSISIIYFTYSKYSVSKETEVVRTIVGDFIAGDVVIGAYVNGEYSKDIPKKDSGYVVEQVVCDNEAVGTWNYEEWSLTTKNLTTRSKCNIYFINQMIANYDYTGAVQKFVAPMDGIYRLEVWGAQGGDGFRDFTIVSNNFYAGYSSGIISLKKDEIIYVSVGGQGTAAKAGNSSAGGWNGGGAGDWDHSDDESCGGGGGATSIQNSLLGDGQLKNYENNKSNILIVAGGSAGTGVTFRNDYFSKYNFSHGGGYQGNSGGYTKWTGDYTLIAGATQSSGYKFGQGASGTDIKNHNNQEAPGGGGGYYGGLTLVQENVDNGYIFGFAGGGSGYIGS